MVGCGPLYFSIVELSPVEMVACVTLQKIQVKQTAVDVIRNLGAEGQ